MRKSVSVLMGQRESIVTAKFIKTEVFYYISLTVIVFAVFGNTLANGFVWDDIAFFTHDAGYKDFDLGTIFLSLANGLEYLPVRDVSYAIDFLNWGDNPAGFHFSNVLIFWLTILVIYVFSGKLLSLFSVETNEQNGLAKTAPFITAALFAVHPIHSEVVSFITCRNALLSGLFFFLSCHLYLLWAEGREKYGSLLYAGTISCFVLSLYSKANGIILPLLLLMLSFFIPHSRRRRSLLGLIPFIPIVAVTFFLFRAIALKTHVMANTPTCATLACLASKVAVALQIPIFYLYKFVVPFNFSADYAIAFPDSMLSVPAMVSLALLTAIVIFAFVVRREFPDLIFSIGWFLIALIPVLNLFPTHPVVADRYAYLPTFSLFFILAVAIVRTVPKKGVLRQAAVSALLMAGSVITITQNRVWHDNISLWSHVMDVSPQSGVAASNLSVALSNLGRSYFREKQDYGKAIELFKRAQQLDKNDSNYDLFSGCLFLMQNDPRSAIAVFQPALLRNENNVEILLNLGYAYEMVGDKTLARQCYLKVVDFASPGYGEMSQRAMSYLERLKK